jgi:alkanesulfonate monooxygenase SsuD/methylene tetrahydromethanopterin reductase-like flavin-dependent oxidoreductase (luciferase family)
MMEGLRLCRAIWRGGAVDWDGRWKMAGGSIAPTPHRPGGPPLWLAGHLPASLARCGKYFDGWMPNGSLPGTWERHWAEIKSAASAAGRDPSALVGSAYVTASVDEDPAAAKARLDAYLESYYGVAALAMHSRQATFAGTPAALKDWIAAHKHSGVQHIVVRCVGDHEEHLQHLVRIRQALN